MNKLLLKKKSSIDQVKQLISTSNPSKKIACTSYCYSINDIKRDILFIPFISERCKSRIERFTIKNKRKSLTPIRYTQCEIIKNTLNEGVKEEKDIKDSISTTSDINESITKCSEKSE